MLVRGTWRIGRIAGIDIVVHPSWLVAFALFAYFSTTLVAPMLAELTGAHLSTTNGIVLGVIASLVLFASVVVHEFAHALVGRRLGIPIGNITLFLFGGVASILREPGTPMDEFKMAAAGPGASVVISVLFAGLTFGADRLGWAWATTLFLLLSTANLVLAVFNLLPAFPSDGGRLLRALLWRITGSQARATAAASIVSAVVAVLLIVWGGYRVIIGQWNGLWLVFIALFLLQAALGSGRQARINLALERMRIGDCMATTLIPVSGDATLAAFLAGAAGDGTRSGYPVVEHGTFVGLVSPRDTGAVPPSLWATTPVSAIMTPAARMPVLSPDAPASDALAAIAKSGVRTLPVLDNGELAGVVSEEIIFSALRDRERQRQAVPA